MIAVIDRHEQPSLMEPMRISEAKVAHAKLADLALELTEQAAALRSRLPDGISTALAHLVRAMNCYYSNLIEGHDTHPIQIERAMKNDYSREPHKRDLQLEAKAHVTVQAWLDAGGLAVDVTTEEAVREIHRRFYDALPDSLKWVEDPETHERLRVVPGALRERDVRVGEHTAVSPGAVPRFLRRFAIAYTNSGRLDAVLDTAAAHHRFLWIHPFLDGNGRVARLMSHHMLRTALNTEGLWSVARGFARQQVKYKSLLSNCDLPKRNDLDGRGTLSEEALVELTVFVIETSIDQVRFMRTLVQPDDLRGRITRWTREQIESGALPVKSDVVLEAVLYRGLLGRGEVPALLAVTDRHARRITSALLSAGVLVSNDDRAPLHLAFPATLASRWMPGLFPDAMP